MSPDVPRGVGFWIAVACGLGLSAVGVVTLARAPSDFTFNVAAWVVGSDLVHDALIVPIVGVVGLVVLRRVHEPYRVPLGAALAWTALVLLASIPLLGAFGRSPKRPSVLPLDYDTAVPTALAIGYVLCVLWLITRVAAARRTATRERATVLPDRSRH